ncbi:hypothetical protein NSK11_contig00106-0004 [Nocardia seriolae]|uniref:Uncharacterized protein n=1 Tax=Nocardia seriolae TaxID=37332 RepID=A0ABC9Z0X7_9NOCA|nr:hypothetical protein NS07_v2contig00102-0032 [Nocardia seriolae]GAP31176.1 hypothetical protein NSK11_contig00106-0004 [Nocardia seriolae]
MPAIQDRETQPSRAPLTADQLRLVPHERPRVDQLVLVHLTHHSRASYTEMTASTGQLRKTTILTSSRLGIHPDLPLVTLSFLHPKLREPQRQTPL